MLEFEGREINLKKIFLYCLKKWWMLFLFFLAGGIALGSLKYYKDIQNYNAKKSTDKSISIEEKIDVAKQNMDEGESRDVALAVSYYDQLIKYEEYLNNSIYINQDPNHVEQITMLYIVELNQPEQYETEERHNMEFNIVAAYVAYIENGAIIQQVSEKYDIEVNYVLELISAAHISETACFSVTIMINDELKGVEQLIESSIIDYSKVVNQSMYEHKVTLVDEYQFTTVNNNISSSNQNIQNTIYTITNRLEDICKNFTSDQMLFYMSETNQEIEMVSGQQSLTKPRMDFFYIMVGCVLGVVFYFAIVLIKNVYSGYIISKSDFATMCALKYIGLIYDQNSVESPSFMDKVEYGRNLKLDYEEQIKNIALKIRRSCPNEEINRIAIISSNFDNINKDEMKDLCVCLKKENIEAIVVDDVLNKSKSLDIFMNVGRCIFVERMGKSKIGLIRDLVHLCKDNDIDTLGVIDIHG